MTSNAIVLIAVVWVCVWILCRAVVDALHRRYVADLEARVEIRRQMRAELAARRPLVRIRGCTCECHHLRPLVPGRARP